MKNNHPQRSRRVVSKISINFFENIILMGIYLLTFRGMNGKFPNEQKFFMHLTEDQNFISKLLLVFSLIVLCTIFLLTVVYLTKRFFLKKYWYIRSNFFFLNSGWVVTLNCLLKVCGYAMLVVSFMSLQRLLTTLTFISLFNFLEKKRDSESQLSPGFFSWNDSKLCRLLVYSLAIAISFPVCSAILNSTTSNTTFMQELKDKINRGIKEVRESFSPEARRSISDIFSKVPFGSLLLSSQEILGNLGKVLTSKETKGGIFVIILLSFIRGNVNQSISSFENF